jgi:hypothetical protein
MPCKLCGAPDGACATQWQQARWLPASSATKPATALQQVTHHVRFRSQAQVLSKQAAKQHLGNVTHKSKSDVPVIFFGTSEIAWVGAKDVASWEEGMRNSYHNKGRKNKKFIVALEQVWDCCCCCQVKVAAQPLLMAGSTSRESTEHEEPVGAIH